VIPIPIQRAPRVRIPLIAPPEARVYDLAQEAQRAGLQIVHSPTRGLELTLLPHAGQVPVGRVA